MPPISPPPCARGWLRLVVLLTLLPGWAVAQSTTQEAERLPLTIHTGEASHELNVEVARTSAERSRGLMERDHLAPEAGMLFLYESPRPPQSGFWMYRTRIPLDIAFIDGAGRIGAIHTMQPCRSSDPGACPATRAGVAYRAALEVNAGYFEARDVTVGDCVTWPEGPKACVEERPEASRNRGER